MAETSAISAAPASDRPSAEAAELPSTDGRRQWPRLAAIVVQLALIVGVFKLFDIESRGLYDRIGPLVLAGFVVNHFLPHRMRLRFFAFLSVLSVVLVFGLARSGPTLLGLDVAGLKVSAWILGLGGALIAACHLRTSHAVRSGVVLAIGGAFALLRTEWIPSFAAIAIPSAVWPILGSMFMFRLIIYLYDIRHGEAPAGPARSIAYFFMLPNVLFTLFPLVDYKTFCRSHYNDDPLRIYQVGLRWIVRGIVQLLLHRLIYSTYVLDPSSVASALEAGQYILTTFLLYLRVSGTFHLIVGVLHLFGFNLPETHYLYFLSPSFSEVWRRMNIYWKDFMQKLVFYPAYSRLKGLGNLAVPVCTIITILVTWALHSYQWFWLKNRFPITWHDCLFWTGLGALMLINSQWELRKGRRRSIGKPRWSLGSAVRYGLCAAGTFCTMSLLWTLWSTPDLQDLKTLARALGRMRIGEAAIILCVPAVIATLAVLTRGRSPEHTDGHRSADSKRREFPFWLRAGEVLTVAGILAVAGFLPPFLSWIPNATETIGRLKHSTLNRHDQARLERGYYEDLGDVTRLDDQLWQAMGGQDSEAWSTNRAIRQRNDALEFDLSPSVSVEFKGVPFSTNSLGMRDREYKKKKDPGTFRILLVGGSHDVGAGVRGEETYENLCEDRLNRESTGSVITRFEILNYSCGAYGPLQKLLTVEQKGLELEPDLVIYAANFLELDWAAHQFDLLADHPEWEISKYFAPLLREAGVAGKDSKATLRKKMSPYRDRVLRMIYGRFASTVASHGSSAAFELLQVPVEKAMNSDVVRIKSLLAETGLPIVDLWGAFDSVPERSSLFITPWDRHTNPQGHALLSDKLFKELHGSGVLPDPDAGK